MSTLPSDLRSKVLEAARRAPSPNVRSRRRGEAIAIALGVLTAIVMMTRAEPALGGRPLVFVILSAVGWAAIAAAATGLGGRGGSMVGRARSVLLVVALAVAPAVFAWVMGCTVGWPEVRTPEGTWSQHMICLALTSLLALGPVIALSLVRHGVDPVHPRATGAAAFAAAGAWGGVLINLHCPLVSPVHVAFGHVLPVLVYAVVGAVLGARLFGVSSKG